MRIQFLAIGALALCAVTTMSVSQMNSSPNTMHVQTIGAADQNAVARFNVYLPLTHTDALEQLLSQQTDQSSPNYHQWLTPAQFKAQFGPSSSDVAKVTGALLAAGFTITAEHTQSLEVEGPVSAVEKMFSTHLMQVRIPNGHMKIAAAEHHLTLPETLVSVGAVIPEFTTHLAAHVHSVKTGRAFSTANPEFRLSSNDSFFYPNDLNEAYQLPSFQTEVEPLFSRHAKQIAGVGSHIGIVISSVIESGRSGEHLQLHTQSRRWQQADPSLLGELQLAGSHGDDPEVGGQRRVRS